jgi:hypothetical protein
MNPFLVWRRPGAMLEQIAGLAVLGGAWYWWLGITESSVSRLLQSASVLLAILALLLAIVRRGLARLSDPAQPGSAGQNLVAMLLLAMSIAAAYYLVWWVPGITSIRGQVVSAVLRFGAAFFLVVTFWGNLLGNLGQKAPVSKPVQTQGAA